MQSRSDLELAWATDTEAASKTLDDGDQDAVMQSEGQAETDPSASYCSLPPLHRMAASGDGGDRRDGATEKIKSEANAEDANKDSGGDGGNADFITCTTTLIIHLDRFSAQPEAKWIKTGDVDEWMYAIAGFAPAAASSTSADGVHAWSSKLHVLDPDPPPTMQDVFSDWSSRSVLGTGRDRRRFISEYLQTPRGQIEILCRLVRGERSAPATNWGLATGESGTSELAKAAKRSKFSSHQTHLSLAVLALFGLAEEYAGRIGETTKEEPEIIESESQSKKQGKGKARSTSQAASSSGSDEFSQRIDGLLMSMPPNLISRALDGMVSPALHHMLLFSSSPANQDPPSASALAVQRGPREAAEGEAASASACAKSQGERGGGCGDPFSASQRECSGVIVAIVCEEGQSRDGGVVVAVARQVQRRRRESQQQQRWSRGERAGRQCPDC